MMSEIKKDCYTCKYSDLSDMDEPCKTCMSFYTEGKFSKWKSKVDTENEIATLRERAEAAEQKLSELQDRTRWHDIDDYPCPSHNEKLELAVRDPFDPTIIEVIHGWWIYEDGDYSVTMFFDDHKNEVAPIKYRPLPEPPEAE